MRIDLDRLDIWIFDFLVAKAEKMPKKIKENDCVLLYGCQDQKAVLVFSWGRDGEQHISWIRYDGIL